MKCPFCGFHDTQVKDSRPSEDGVAIRRRRFCQDCGARFTTYERVQLKELIVRKRGGEKTPFNRDKLTHSISIATRKRDINEEQVEITVSNIVRNLERRSRDNEITTKQIGEEVMEALLNLDKVSYVRFASVYRDFNTAQDFEEFISAIDR